jgi:hypothetical protein
MRKVRTGDNTARQHCLGAVGTKAAVGWCRGVGILGRSRCSCSRPEESRSAEKGRSTGRAAVAADAGASRGSSVSVAICSAHAELAAVRAASGRRGSGRRARARAEWCARRGLRWAWVWRRKSEALAANHCTRAAKCSKASPSPLRHQLLENCLSARSCTKPPTKPETMRLAPRIRPCATRAAAEHRVPFTSPGCVSMHSPSRTAMQPQRAARALLACRTGLAMLKPPPRLAAEPSPRLHTLRPGSTSACSLLKAPSTPYCCAGSRCFFCCYRAFTQRCATGIACTPHLHPAVCCHHCVIRPPAPQRGSL